MKKIILKAFLLFAFSTVHAQFANTKWKSLLKTDDPDSVEALFIFSGDTVKVFRADNNLLVETMMYTCVDSVVVFRKFTGGSPCTSLTIGKYRISKSGDDILFSIIADECDYRAAILNKTLWTKL